jgi:hypothetical protein
VTRDGDKLCDVVLDNGNMRIGLWNVTQRESSSPPVRLRSLRLQSTKFSGRIVLCAIQFRTFE